MNWRILTQKTRENGELVNCGSKGVLVTRSGLTHKTFSPRHGLMDFERSITAFLVTLVAMSCQDWFHPSPSWRASFPTLKTASREINEN